MLKRIRRAAVLAFVVLCFAAGVFPGPPQQRTQPEEKARPQLRRLVRSDLLDIEAEPLAPPLRNIFAPQRPGSAQGRPGAPGFRVPEDPSTEAVEDPGEEGEETLTIVYDLRYIGFVRSSDRIVGVVVFEGETLAVKAGDLISAGVTILKITPEEIVFQGTDAVSRTVSLEGEDQ
jgi:hypothetical protein